MEKRKTYKVEDQLRTLVYQDYHSDNGDLLYFKDFQSPSSSEKFLVYNAKGNIISERESLGGLETSRIEFFYDKKGRIKMLKQFISGELFEQTDYNYQADKKTERTFQFGEEIYHSSSEKNGALFTAELFENGELIEKKVGNNDPNSDTQIIEIFNGDNELIYVKISKFDSSQRIIKREEKNKHGILILLEEYTYTNDLLVNYLYKSSIEGIYSNTEYEYDKNKNLISQKSFSPTGQPLDFYQGIYDDQNRIIEEFGYSTGSFNAIYGTYAINQKYLFQHEYST